VDCDRISDGNSIYYLEGLFLKMASRDKEYGEKIGEIQNIIHSLKEGKKITIDSKYKKGQVLIKEAKDIIEEVEYELEIFS